MSDRLPSPDGDHPDGPERPSTAWNAAIVDRYVIPIGLFGLAWLLYAWLTNGRSAALDYFVPLADAFVHGHLGLIAPPPWLNEVVPASNGLSYVVYPPFPAILLIPVVAITGTDFEQTWASVVVGAASVPVIWSIMGGMGVSRGPRFVLTLVFAFGTIVWYSAQAGSSWHFAHVVATLFMLLAIRACQLDLRAGLIGLLFAGAILSRLPLILATPFFAAYLADLSWRIRDDVPGVFGALRPSSPPAWRTRIDPGVILDAGIPLALGVGVPMIAYLIYNDVRFGSFTENGYALIPGLLQEDQYRHGFFSVVNIPRKLYAMFLSAPVQVGEFPWIQSRHLGGLSILLTTPLFLWAIRARRPDWFGLGAWASVGLILVPILMHADPGGAQFGFRYAQDLYPFLFLLMVRGLRGRVSFEAWVAIAIGAVVNIWGMGSTYFDWWA